MPQVVEARITGGRLIKGTEGRLEATVYVDGTATATDDDPTTPTVTITRADGTVLKSAQSTTKASAGVYYYDLTPAELSRVDSLTVALAGTWQGASCSFTLYTEVTGDPLFTIAEARAFDAETGGSGAMSNTTNYPAATILQARDAITDWLEAETRIGWVPRHARYTVDGPGGTELKLEHRYVNELIAASISGTAVTLTDVTLREVPGVLVHETSAWSAGDPENITVEYEYGRRGLPDDVTRIALLLLRDRLVKSAVPDNALQVNNDLGAYQLVVAGGPMGNRTRIPEVNAWLSKHSLKPPVAD